jgi:hypothetical protein
VPPAVTQETVIGDDAQHGDRREECAQHWPAVGAGCRGTPPLGHSGEMEPQGRSSSWFSTPHAAAVSMLADGIPWSNCADADRSERSLATAPCLLLDNAPARLANRSQACVQPGNPVAWTTTCRSGSLPPSVSSSVHHVVGLPPAIHREFRPAPLAAY